MEKIVLDNRYVLGERIGVGGMAYVYDAFDQLLKRNVAVKILKDQFVEQEDFLQKFNVEAQSSASLADDNIVSIYDVGSTVVNDRAIHYIVMEKVNGQTLKDVIEEKAPFSDQEIVYYAKQIAKALKTAHNNGIVHRDIKPANILLTENNKVKVADFGIARVSSSATITYTSSILGTVHYISPEQAKGQHIDNRSDLYSLGIVMYEMATGNVPFDGDNSVGIAIKHIQEDVPMANLKNEKISKNLSYIINKCLEKNINNRYQNASELIYDLENYKDLKMADTVEIVNPDLAETAVINTKQVKYQSKKEEKEVSPKKKTNKKLINKIYVLAVSLLVLLSAFFIINKYTRSQVGKNYVKVPNLIDIAEEEAMEKLKDNDLKGKVVKRENSDTVIKGNVIDQLEEANTELKKGSTVELVVSEGKEEVLVPDITGYEIKYVEQMLNEKGLELGRTTTDYSDDKRKDMVIRQEPMAREKVEKGSKVDIVVSLGKKIERVPVPRLVGQKQETAIQSLQALGLSVGKIDQDYSDEFTENFVIKQSIKAGKEVDLNTQVNIVISLGPKPLPEPEPEPEPDPIPEPEPEPEEELKDKKYILDLQVPSGDEESFKVDIYNLIPSKTLIHSQVYNKSDASDGVIKVELIAKENAEFEIYYDGKQVQVHFD